MMEDDEKDVGVLYAVSFGHLTKSDHFKEEFLVPSNSTDQ